MKLKTKKREEKRRSNCPINYALEIFGDTWSLLIIRDIIFAGKRTYGDFLNSREGIATNILTARLTLLEREGILHKKRHEVDKRKEVYSLTEKGLDLIPVLLEIGNWSAKYDTHTSAPKEFIARVHKNRKKMIEKIREMVRKGEGVFSQLKT